MHALVIEQDVMAVTRTGATFMFRIEYEEGTPRWFRMDSYAMPPPLGLTVSVASPKGPTRIVFLRHIDSLTQHYVMTAQSTARTLDQLIRGAKSLCCGGTSHVQWR